jgi:peptide/nickel transport system permease protein
VIRYILRRTLLLLPVLFSISLVTFYAMHLVPGDVVDQILGTQAEVTPERVAEIKRAFGLDRPVLLQYWDWAQHAVRGDLGHSLRSGRSVAGDILARLPVTYELALIALFLACAVGIPAGLIAGFYRNSAFDAVARVLSLVGMSIPNFWLATLLILMSSRWLGWLPRLGYVGIWSDPLANLSSMLWPAVALSTAVSATIARLLRSSVLEVLTQDYVKTARGKGLSSSRVVWRHVLKNALIPALTIVGIQAGYLLAGAVVIEEIFSMPGTGRLVLNAIFQRDYPVIQGGVLIITLTFALINLLVDVLYAYVDPRIHYG